MVGNEHTKNPSVLVLNVMLLLQLCKLLFSSRKLRLCSRGILLCRHMIQYNDVPLLQVEAVQVIKSILSLVSGQTLSDYATSAGTHIHHVVKDDECSPLCFRLTTNPNLANAPIPSEQVVEILACDLVIQVLDEQDPVCAGWQFGLAAVE